MAEFREGLTQEKDQIVKSGELLRIIYIILNCISRLKEFNLEMGGVDMAIFIKNKLNLDEVAEKLNEDLKVIIPVLTGNTYGWIIEKAKEHANIEESVDWFDEDLVTITDEEIKEECENFFNIPGISKLYS